VVVIVVLVVVVVEVAVIMAVAVVDQSLPECLPTGLAPNRLQTLK